MPFTYGGTSGPMAYMNNPTIRRRGLQAYGTATAQAANEAAKFAGPGQAARRSVIGLMGAAEGANAQLGQELALAQAEQAGTIAARNARTGEFAAMQAARDRDLAEKSFEFQKRAYYDQDARQSEAARMADRLAQRRLGMDERAQRFNEEVTNEGLGMQQTQMGYDRESQLAQLAQLRQAGRISQSEFDLRKGEVERQAAESLRNEGRLDRQLTNAERQQALENDYRDRTTAWQQQMAEEMARIQALPVLQRADAIARLRRRTMETNHPLRDITGLSYANSQNANQNLLDQLIGDLRGQVVQ